MFMYDLQKRHGQEAAKRVADAFDAAIRAATLPQGGGFPDRPTRLAIVAAIIAEGEKSGFEAATLSAAGLAAVGKAALEHAHLLLREGVRPAGPIASGSMHAEQR